MNRVLKRVISWVGLLIGVVAVLITSAVAVLMTPGPFFPADKTYGAITVHSETPIGPEIDSIMTEILARLEATPVYDRERKLNLCLCATQDKFTFFARLTRRADRIMGFGFWHTCYVNGDFVVELAARTGGRPKYAARSGSIVHVATHELMHLYLENGYGSMASRWLPYWKTEGYCEYGVNQYVAPRDSGYAISDRLDIYLDGSQWNSTAEIHRPHYIWGLMMEYLINVKGMDLHQVMADSVTKEAVYQELLTWRASFRDQDK